MQYIEYNTQKKKLILHTPIPNRTDIRSKVFATSSNPFFPTTSPHSKPHFIPPNANIITKHLSLSKLNTTSGAKNLLNIGVDSELTGSEGTDHEKTSTNTSVRTLKTKLLSDLDQTRGGRLSRSTRGLVDLRKHSIGGLRNKRSRESSNQTRAQVGNGLRSRSHVLLRESGENGLRNLLEDHELGHSVRNLLEKNRSETGVESADALILRDLGESREEAGSELGLGNETDASGLERAESDIGEELGEGGGGEVDGSAVLGRVLNTEKVDGLLLEKLVTSELEGSLEEVAGDGGAEAGEEGRGTILSDDLAEGTDHASVVLGRVKLDTGLDAGEKVSLILMTCEAGMWRA